MSTGKFSSSNRIDYSKETRLCADFILNYEDYTLNSDPLHGRKKYLRELQRVLDGGEPVVEVALSDVEDYYSKSESQAFASHIATNTRRYVKLFSDAADQVIEDTKMIRLTPQSDQDDFENALDNFRLNNYDKMEGPKPPKEITNLLKRKFEISIILAPVGGDRKMKITPLRSLKSNLIGHLVEVRAMVVRITEVKPLISIACYVCESCGCEIYQQVNRRFYTPTLECPSTICTTNNSKGRIAQNFAVSKFIPFQELKIQETSDQTPIGSIPRSFTVQCRGGLTRQCTPGDIITLTAMYLPKVNESQMMARRDLLTHDTYLEATRIIQEKKRYAELHLTESIKKELLEESRNANVYSKLALSICPEIFGLDHVKKALLLQMMSGSTLKLDDGMRIRGDINIALIGDPGVAKSQLLKHIAHLTPRGVYTSGKGSSGAGLTASVMRDQITNEIMLEGGALVLADMGVCCIDEFDKMEEKDRTSIHEVMEQQTVSIAKAGITTTLNARTSILAAANPVYGRYNKARTPHENINLPPSLLSRFDLIFILLDRPDEAHDLKMASHITYVHQTRSHPKNKQDIYDNAFLRSYISHAKTFNPTIGYDLHAHIVQKYVDKRQKLDKEQAKTTYGYTTPRTLLAVIRLSQALAKLRFSNEVCKDDVEEALNLMEESQRSVIDQGESNFRANAKKDPISQIFNLLKAECESKTNKTITKTAFEHKKGMSVADLNKCLSKYTEIDVLMVSEDKDEITLIQSGS